MTAIPMSSIDVLTAPERHIPQTSTAAPPESTLTAGPFSTRPPRFSIAGREFVVESEREPPSWVEPTFNALDHLLSMPAGWDSYGAKPIDPANVVSAMVVALLLMHDRTPAPAVVPTSSGGVQLEWHACGIDLEVEIRSPSRISACFEDERLQTAWDVEQLHDFRPVRDALRELAQR